MSKQVSLGEMCVHLAKLFGNRNALYLPGIQERIGFLMIGARGIEDAIEEEVRSPECGVALASLFGRICAMVEHFQVISLSETMSQKYPLQGCGYCGQRACNCAEGKLQDHQLSPVSAIKLDWGIEHWKKHVDLVYGHTNHHRGIDVALRRLCSEIIEIQTLWMITTHSERGYDQQNLRQMYACELADTFAWVTVIASLLHINLEEAVVSLYGLPETPCHKCEELPCGCGPFNMSERRLVLSADSADSVSN